MGTVTQLFDENIGSHENVMQALSGVSSGHWLGELNAFPSGVKTGSVLYHTRYDSNYIRGNDSKWYRVVMRNKEEEGK